MEEKRKSVRTRALKGGRIVINDGMSTIDCTIRNLSAGGAKLLLETSVGIPERFTLSLADGVSHICQVKWRTIKEIGVGFEDQAISSPE